MNKGIAAGEWGRSFVSILAGFATIFVLSVATDWVMHAVGLFPQFGRAMGEPLFVIAALYRALYTIIGGYVTARLAPTRPFRHAVALAALGLCGGIAGVFAYYSGDHRILGPAWYALFIPASAVPCIVAGALIRIWRHPQGRTIVPA